MGDVMDGLLPMIRRVRRPLVPVEGPAGGTVAAPPIPAAAPVVAVPDPAPVEPVPVVPVEPVRAENGKSKRGQKREAQSTA